MIPSSVCMWSKKGSHTGRWITLWAGAIAKGDTWWPAFQSAALSHPWMSLVLPGKSPTPPASYPCSRLLHGVSCVVRNVQGQYIILINETQIHRLAGLIRMGYVNPVCKVEVLCVCVWCCEGI